MPPRGFQWLAFTTLLLPRAWANPRIYKPLTDGSFDMPLAGMASATHYTLDPTSVAACGCSRNATSYPVAALSREAFGSDTGSGPGCGRCFNITLSSAWQADPPFNLTAADAPWKVIKVVDECPSATWCSASPGSPNKAGMTVHFDLMSPSSGIPQSFFPSDPSVYGYSDFGVWYVNYSSVSCENWEGWTNSTALGLDPKVKSFAGPGSGVCCPADPLTDNATCPSTSGSESRASSFFAHGPPLYRAASWGAAGLLVALATLS